MTDSATNLTMNFSDHLEDLRSRLIWSLVGIAVMCGITLYFGDYIVAWLQQPLHHAQRKAGLPAKTFGFSVTTGFAIYIKVSLISGFILAGPWILYQAWKFVEAGLYSTEKKVVYILSPFSTVMIALGVSFAYYIMLPLCLAFLITFTVSYPDAGGTGPSFMDRLTDIVEEMTAPSKASPIAVPSSPQNLPLEAPPPEVSFVTESGTLRIPILEIDPVSPGNGEIWFSRHATELKIMLDGHIRSVPLATSALMSPMIEIGDYISFVTILTLGVVIAFQLPLIMLVVGWTGIIHPNVIASYRKHCIFVCFFLGALLTPADPVSMIVLAVPLWVLFEMGLVLMRFTVKPQTAGPE